MKIRVIICSMNKPKGLILSASGWRKIFTVSGNEEDSFPKIGKENAVIAMLAAEIFADYVIEKSGNKNPIIVCAIDTRPTGPSIADAVLRVFHAKGIVPRYLGIAPAPEIMACSIHYDGFLYISASHNPIGHNGIKFGLNNGGVLEGSENSKLADIFLKKWEEPGTAERLSELVKKCIPAELDWTYMNAVSAKKESAAYYHNFMMQVISASDNPATQQGVFAMMRAKAVSRKIDIVCDMNGSARTMSIDSAFFKECGITLHTINDTPGQIVHGIIPEGRNLDFCACELERLQASGCKNAVLGYMPDCDGDRGNIVYWDKKAKKAKVLQAQEVFALSVLSELAYGSWWNAGNPSYKPAVVVNGPTSMRIEEIAAAFGAEVFRAEVGEANVVNLAREKREAGYTVRILGEGSNGGNITYPESVRDPLNTIFAILRLLIMSSDDEKYPNLFKIWCKAKGIVNTRIPESVSISEILATIPKYSTTGTLEERAIMHIKTTDHSLLKKRFQKEFESDWNVKAEMLKKKYGIVSYQAVATNGTKETKGITDFSVSGKGGLKIIFFSDEEKKNPAAFVWMRGSGTEPVFRVLCDVKGANPDTEYRLLQWERELIEAADQAQS